VISVRQVSCVLIHHPVLDKQGATVTAAITNIDLHDISRSAHTYGCERFYVVHPVAAQRALAERIREHWVEGSGGVRIPDRKPALAGIQVVDSIDAALSHAGSNAQFWTTSAKRVGSNVLSFSDARDVLRTPGPPIVIGFGTGWGLAAEVHERASAHLTPIESVRSDGYNHLSVRAAAAILFDRLLGAAG
jgi:hypothetical protein